ncbi:MAG: methyltransferase [Clostridiaceae bacterium]|nr:methyltransferase [Clostridiaceae bacterium]
MKLNISNWKPFKIANILTIINGRGITTDEIEENKGDFIAVQSGEQNNGLIGRIDFTYCRRMDYVFSESPCLTVARTGSAGFVSFQEKGCVVGDSAKILLLNEAIATNERYLFIQTLLNSNRFKYSYGRKVTEKKYMNDIIDLPVLHKSDSELFIDEKHEYSEQGYVPDWNFMDDYIKSLNYQPPISKNKRESTYKLNTNYWKFFLLKDICKISMGNGMDLSAMTMENPQINFVGRSADNNGVANKVDVVFDKKRNPIEPHGAGCITVALGGSLGAAFLHSESFYTSQNVAVLEFESFVSDYAKIFITTCIMNESKFKYFPFGRELNTHINKKFGFTLPIKLEADNRPSIDDQCSYSSEGYIPDWLWMDNYIKSLPLGDCL